MWRQSGSCQLCTAWLRSSTAHILLNTLFILAHEHTCKALADMQHWQARHCAGPAAPPTSPTGHGKQLYSVGHSRITSQMKAAVTEQSLSSQAQAPSVVLGIAVPPAQNWPSGWPVAQWVHVVGVTRSFQAKSGHTRAYGADRCVV
jgi:hypothetical protein